VIEALDLGVVLNGAHGRVTERELDVAAAVVAASMFALGAPPNEGLEPSSFALQVRARATMLVVQLKCEPLNRSLPSS